ncbi:hypothetical protein ADUPG1_000339 [Aduncisulcus paluster]|uniref:Uncharacterized protein n=1 Tax=Aduncisulcus paluster TaxID=2918883 RepID=A0ABQ5K5Y1_9EUKA|nr:hypothetical protein ADUPG1_000339 [Aduncisulcus paluster]
MKPPIKFLFDRKYQISSSRGFSPSNTSSHLHALPSTSSRRNEALSHFKTYSNIPVTPFSTTKAFFGSKLARDSVFEEVSDFSGLVDALPSAPGDFWPMDSIMSPRFAFYGSHSQLTEPCLHAPSLDPDYDYPPLIYTTSHIKEGGESYNPIPVDTFNPIDSSFPGKQRFSSFVHADDTQEEDPLAEGVHDDFEKEEEEEDSQYKESSDMLRDESSSDHKHTSKSRYKKRASCDSHGCRNPFVHEKEYNTSKMKEIHFILCYLLFMSYLFKKIDKGKSPYRSLFLYGCFCEKCVVKANKFWNNLLDRGFGEKKCGKIVKEFKLKLTSDDGQRTLYSLISEVIENSKFSKTIVDSMKEGLLETFSPMLHAVLPSSYWSAKHEIAKKKFPKSKSKKVPKTSDKSTKLKSKREKLHDDLIKSIPLFRKEKEVDGNIIEFYCVPEYLKSQESKMK